MGKLRIAGLVEESITDGPGFRFAVYTQGCRHNCEGCHNPQTHDLEGGSEADTDEIASKIAKNPLLDGLTLSGGEPFLQAKAAAELARAVKKTGLSVVAFTGYTFEELIAGADGENGWRGLLEAIDILIDGRFELSKRSLSLLYAGSTNQRVLDAVKSLAQNEAVLYPVDEFGNIDINGDL